MKKKSIALHALFLVLFVPAHSFLTVFLLQRLFSGASGVFLKIVTVILALPIPFPMVLSDPDGDRIPPWLQVLSFPVNSLVWGVGLSLLFGLVKHRLARFEGEERDRGLE